MRLETILSRRDLPALEKLVTNCRGGGQHGGDRAGFSSRMLTFCLLAGNIDPFVQGQGREGGLLDL